MKVGGFHHVGILTRDFESIRHVFGDVLGCEVGDIHPFPELGVDIMWVHVNGVGLEFLRPNGDGDLERLMSSGVTGVHHIGLEVDDVDAALAEAREAGLGLIDQVSRPAAFDMRMGFLDPGSVGSTIVEFLAQNRPGSGATSKENTDG